MKRLLLTLSIISLFVIPQFALGDDVADLKAVGDKLVKAYNTLDADTVASMIYPGAVTYDYDAAFPDVAPVENTQVKVTQDLKMLFGQLEFLSITPYNMQAKVVGNTGITWGHYTVNAKPKGQTSIIVRHARITGTWIKSDGKWFALMAHYSAIPSGD